MPRGFEPPQRVLDGDASIRVKFLRCTFLQPLVYPGEVEVRMYLAEPGRTSVGTFYEIFKDGTKHADGAAKVVWIDLATGRSVPLPEMVTAPLQRARIGQHRDATRMRKPAVKVGEGTRR